MDYPIPSHLHDKLVPIGTENSEFEITAKVRCSCGGETFRLRQSNGRQVVYLTCTDCGEEFLLFDAGKHGWDGFVCHNDFLNRNEQPESYFCAECGADGFALTVRIDSQGKQDFLEECVRHDDSFSPEDWVDGFEWITVHLHCAQCGSEEEGWLDLETM